MSSDWPIPVWISVGFYQYRTVVQIYVDIGMYNGYLTRIMMDLFLVIKIGVFSQKFSENHADESHLIIFGKADENPIKSITMFREKFIPVIYQSDLNFAFSTKSQ